MSKLVPAKDIGVPVPSPAADPTDDLIAYYGPTGFTPSYSQSARVDLGPISALKTLSQGTPAVTYWDIPLSSILPQGSPPGAYDVRFTLMDASGNEGDFSPPVTETLPAPPPTLGQPIILG